MICIPAWQRAVHVLTEAASVLAVPAVFAAARAVPWPHRARLRALGWAMVVVDGLLLVRWVALAYRAPR